MKTRRKRMTGPVMIGLMMLPCALHAQVTLESNTITGTEYVGCDANSNQPLRFSTLANFRHEWRTNDLFRFRLNKTETYGTLGGFTNVPANGFALISPNDNFINNAPGPFSLLHLADADGPNTASYRDWMRIGVSFTTNNDHTYVGHKVEDGVDQTAAVIHKQRLRRPRSETTVG